MFKVYALILLDENHSLKQTFLISLLYSRQTWLSSSNFSVKGCLPLIQKDSVTHLHVLTVYVNKGLPFPQDSSLENSEDCYLSLVFALLHFVSYFFFLCQSMSVSLCKVLNTISSNIDEVHSINSSVNVFIFGYLNVDHKD